MYFHTQKKQTLLQAREDVCSHSGGRAKPLQIPQGEEDTDSALPGASETRPAVSTAPPSPRNMTPREWYSGWAMRTLFLFYFQLVKLMCRAATLPRTW